MYRATIASAAIIIISACGKSSGNDPTSCEAIGAHYFEIVEAEIDKAEGDDKKNAVAMRSLLPKMKTKMVAECKKDEWSVKTRECLASASSASAGKECWNQPRPIAPKQPNPASNPADKPTPKAAKPDTGGM